MPKNKRRSAILKIIMESKDPISATTLAKKFKVSRQIIVGDVALLRASGEKIIATPRGYIINTPNDRYIAKVAVNHTAKETETELRSLLDIGVYILDVSVEHPIYGEISGQLDFHTHEDIDTFMDNLKNENASLLSDLTQGTHIHTLSCNDATHFKEAQALLSTLGFLL